MRIPLDSLAPLGFTFIEQTEEVIELKLNNGLKVLLAENHTAPVVTTMVVYRVGSRNEGVGRTGATHFLEHLMFKSTDKYDHARGRGLDDMLKPIGAYYNATTSEDRTNYFECVPREHLGLALSIEADRMRNLRLIQSERDAEMTVVRSEFEIDENDPGAVLDKELTALAFRAHPYHHPTIGWRSDVEKVALHQLREFYDCFYWPNNATLIVTGDFDLLPALALIAEHFGPLPRSPRAIPSVSTVEPEQQGTRRFVLKRAGDDLAQVLLGFHVPASSHPDYYALCMVRDILGGDHRLSSRLHAALIETGLAVDVFADCPESRDPGLFKIGATVAAQSTPEQVEQALLAELRKLATDGVPQEELARSQEANRNSSVIVFDDPIAFAEQLCEAEAVHDWKWLISFGKRIDSVTAANVSSVVKEYLHEDNLTVGYYLPQALPEEEEDTEDLEEEEDADLEEEEVEVAGQTAAAAVPSPSNGEITEEPAAVPSHQPRSPDQTTARSTIPDRPIIDTSRVTKYVLPNGLTLLVYPVPDAKAVSVVGRVRAGRYYAPLHRRSLADATAGMLSRGSRNYSQEHLGQLLEEMGTELTFSPDNFAVSFESKLGPAHLDRYLDLLADQLRKPLFEAEALQRWSNQYAGLLQSQASDPSNVARGELTEELYEPPHICYEEDLDALLEELKELAPAELKRFHKRFFTAKNTLLTIVGNVSVVAVRELVERKFGSWSGKAAKSVHVPFPRLPKKPARLNVPLEDKASAQIVIGVPCPLKADSPDRLAAILANAALGRDTIASRLGSVVREKYGLTYGVSSRFEETEFGAAPWIIELSTNPANVDRALELVAQVVNEYRQNGISAQELADEAGQAWGSLVVSMRDSLGIARALTDAEFSGRGFHSLQTFGQRLQAITVDQVNQAIKQYLRFDRAITVVAGAAVENV